MRWNDQTLAKLLILGRQPSQWSDWTGRSFQNWRRPIHTIWRRREILQRAYLAHTLCHLSPGQCHCLVDKAGTSDPAIRASLSLGILSIKGRKKNSIKITRGCFWYILLFRLETEMLLGFYTVRWSMVTCMMHDMWHVEVVSVPPSGQ